jgi:hypothetical protein
MFSCHPRHLARLMRYKCHFLVAIAGLAAALVILFGNFDPAGFHRTVPACSISQPEFGEYHGNAVEISGVVMVFNKRKPWPTLGVQSFSSIGVSDVRSHQGIA